MAHHGTHALPSRKAFAKTVDIFLYTAFGIRFGPAYFPIGSASIVSYCVQAFLLCDRLFQPFPPFQDLDLPPAFLRFTVGEDASYYRLYTSPPSIICILSVGMSSPHMSYHIMHIHMPLRPFRPHRESNPGPSPECAAAFTTRPPRPILLRLTPTEHLWYGDNKTLEQKKMHDIYFTLSRASPR